MDLTGILRSLINSFKKSTKGMARTRKGTGIKWQEVAAIGGGAVVTIFLAIAGILNLTSMEHTIPEDQVCSVDCFSRIDVNSTYWEIAVEHSGTENPLLYKKVNSSRRLWLNLDKIGDAVPATPDIGPPIIVEMMVKTNGPGTGGIFKVEDDWLRPVKDGDILIARKTSSNPRGDTFYIHGRKHPWQTVKWGFNFSDQGDFMVREGIQFDPFWIASPQTNNTYYGSPMTLQNDNIITFTDGKNVSFEIAFNTTPGAVGYPANSTLNITFANGTNIYARHYVTATNQTAYIPFEELTSTTAKDWYGIYNATLASGAAWHRGGNCTFGGCLAFDGGTNSYATLDALAARAWNGSRYVSWWMKLGTGNVANDRLLDNSDSGPNGGFQVQYQSDLTVDLLVRGAGTSTTATLDSTFNETNVWHHWTFTQGNSSGTSGKCELYVDGQLQESDSTCGMGITSAVFTLGKRAAGSNQANVTIDDLRIGTRYLNQSEAYYLYQTGRGGGNLSQVYSYGYGNFTMKSFVNISTPGADTTNPYNWTFYNDTKGVNKTDTWKLVMIGDAEAPTDPEIILSNGSAYVSSRNLVTCVNPETTGNQRDCLGNQVNITGGTVVDGVSGKAISMDGINDEIAVEDTLQGTNQSAYTSVIMYRFINHGETPPTQTNPTSRIHDLGWCVANAGDECILANEWDKSNNTWDFHVRGSGAIGRLVGGFTNYSASISPGTYHENDLDMSGGAGMMIDTGQFNCMAGTYNRTTGMFRFFSNGELYVENNVTANHETAGDIAWDSTGGVTHCENIGGCYLQFLKHPTQESNATFIGRTQFQTTHYAEMYFDYMYTWNRELSTDEIRLMCLGATVNYTTPVNVSVSQYGTLDTELYKNSTLVSTATVKFQNIAHDGGVVSYIANNSDTTNFTLQFPVWTLPVQPNISLQNGTNLYYLNATDRIVYLDFEGYQPPRRNFTNGIIYDKSGNRVNGFAFGSPRANNTIMPTRTLTGMGVNLNGTGYIEIGKNYSKPVTYLMDPLNRSFAISFEFKLNDTNQNGDIFMDWRDMDGTDGGFISYEKQRLNLTIRQGSSTSGFIGTRVLSNQTWYKVVAAYDDANGRISLFLNGELDETKTGVKMTRPQTQMKIGAAVTSNSIIDSATDLDNGLNFTIDEFTIWKRALNQSDAAILNMSSIASGASNFRLSFGNTQSDQTCALYRNGSSVSNPDTATLPAGLYVYEGNCTRGENITASSIKYYFTVTSGTSDTTNPTFTDNHTYQVDHTPGTGSLLNQDDGTATYQITYNLSFDILPADNVAIDQCILEFGSGGNQVNYTQTYSGSNVSVVKVGSRCTANVTSQGGGSYLAKMIFNDTSGNTNGTRIIFNFINQSWSTTRSFINDKYLSQTFDTSDTVNITGNSTTSIVGAVDSLGLPAFRIWNNNTQIESMTGGRGVWVAQLFTLGTHNITFNSTGNRNYSSFSNASLLLTITAAAGRPDITLNNGTTTISSAGLISCYTFDNTTAGCAGNTSRLDLFDNAMVNVTGFTGSGLGLHDFDDTSAIGAYATAPNPIVTNMSAFTLSVDVFVHGWGRRGTSAGGALPRIFNIGKCVTFSNSTGTTCDAYGNERASNNSIDLFLQEASGGIKISVGISNGSYSNDFDFPSPPGVANLHNNTIRVGEWNRIIARFDNSTNDICVWVNGDLDGCADIVTNNDQFDDFAGGQAPNCSNGCWVLKPFDRIWFGRIHWNGASSGQNLWHSNNTLDNFLLWNRSLTDAEVSMLSYSVVQHPRTVTFTADTTNGSVPWLYKNLTNLTSATDSISNKGGWINFMTNESNANKTLVASLFVRRAPSNITISNGTYNLFVNRTIYYSGDKISQAQGKPVNESTVVIYDESGNGYDGISLRAPGQVSGGPVPILGKFGSALGFDKSQSDNLIVGRPFRQPATRITNGTINGTFSLSFWVNISNSNEAFARIVSYEDASQVNGFQITPLYNGNISVNIRSGSQVMANMSAPMLNMTWTFVVLTFNSTSTTAKLYLNGTLVSTDTSVMMTRPSFGMWLGRPSTGLNNRVFDGGIDEFSLWNGKELNASEIYLLYNSTIEAGPSNFGYTETNNQDSDISYSFSRNDSTVNNPDTEVLSANNFYLYELNHTEGQNISSFGIALPLFVGAFTGAAGAAPYFADNNTYNYRENTPATNKLELESDYVWNYWINGNISFDINVTDPEGLADACTLQFDNKNYSKSSANVSLTETLAGRCSANITSQIAGNHSFRWYVNDTGGTYNSTPIINITINKRSPYIFSAFITSMECNIDSSATYPDIPSRSCNEQNYGDKDMVYQLWRNQANSTGQPSDTIISFVNGSGDAQTTVSDTMRLGVGVWTYKYNVSTTSGGAGVNFTTYNDDIISFTLSSTISKGTPDVKTFINDLETDQTVDDTDSVVIKGNSTTTITPPTFDLFISSLTDTGNPASITDSFSAGTYPITYNTSGNANYTSAENTTLTLTTIDTDAPSNNNLRILLNSRPVDRIYGIGSSVNVSLGDANTFNQMCLRVLNGQHSCGNSMFNTNLTVPNKTVITIHTGAFYDATAGLVDNTSINISANTTLGKYQRFVPNSPFSQADNISFGINGIQKVTFPGIFFGDSLTTSRLSNKARNLVIFPEAGESTLYLNVTSLYNYDDWVFNNISFVINGTSANSQSVSFFDDFRNRSFINASSNATLQWQYENGHTLYEDRWQFDSSPSSPSSPCGAHSSTSYNINGITLTAVGDLSDCGTGGIGVFANSTDMSFTNISVIELNTTTEHQNDGKSVFNVYLVESTGLGPVTVFQYDTSSDTHCGTVGGACNIKINRTGNTFRGYVSNTLTSSGTIDPSKNYLMQIRVSSSCPGVCTSDPTGIFKVTNISVSGTRGRQLAGGAYTNGTIESIRVQNFSSNIIAAKLSADVTIPTGTSIDWFLSPNNGSTWESTTLGEVHLFSASGSELKWKANIFTNDNTIENDTGFPSTAVILRSVNLTGPTGYPADIEIDVGNDGTVDYTKTGELNSSTSPVTVSINIGQIHQNYTRDNCAAQSSCNIPIVFTSSQTGSLDVTSVSYVLKVGQISFNETYITEWLLTHNQINITTWSPDADSINVTRFNFTTYEPYNLTLTLRNATSFTNTSTIIAVKNWPINVTLPPQTTTFNINATSCGGDGSTAGCFQNGTFFPRNQTRGPLGYFYNITNTDGFVLNISARFASSVIVPACMQFYLTNSSSNIYSMDSTKHFNITNTSETLLMRQMAKGSNQTYWGWIYANNCEPGEIINPDITFTTNQSFYP